MFEVWFPVAIATVLVESVLNEAIHASVARCDGVSKCFTGLEVLSNLVLVLVVAF